MSDAAAEIRHAQNAENNDIVNCPGSCDGTWQKRGFSSQNGCVAVISIDTGKGLDVEAMSKSCKQCQLHSHLDKDSVEYQLWRADHNHCTALQTSKDLRQPWSLKGLNAYLDVQ